MTWPERVDSLRNRACKRGRMISYRHVVGMNCSIKHRETVYSLLLFGCVLALVSYLRPNLLLLDKPTNHLDLDASGACGRVAGLRGRRRAGFA